MRYLIIILLLCIYTQTSVSSMTSGDSQREYPLFQIKEIERESYKQRLIEAIIFKESNNRNVTVEDMVGYLQIRPIMVREVNNILGYTKYSLKDRENRDKSTEMFKIFTDHHTPDWNEELVCRRWNGGYKGEKKESTKIYYNRIKQILK